VKEFVRYLQYHHTNTGRWFVKLRTCPTFQHSCIADECVAFKFEKVDDETAYWSCALFQTHNARVYVDKGDRKNIKMTTVNETGEKLKISLSLGNKKE